MDAGDIEGKQGWVFGAFLARADSNKYYEIIGGVAQEEAPINVLPLRHQIFRSPSPAVAWDKLATRVAGILSCVKTAKFQHKMAVMVPGDLENGNARVTRLSSSTRSILCHPTNSVLTATDRASACAMRNRNLSKNAEKKSGCVRKRRKVLAMPADNQFAIDGQGVCIYP